MLVIASFLIALSFAANDSDWTTIDVPRKCAIEGNSTTTIDCDFSTDSIKCYRDTVPSYVLPKQIDTSAISSRCTVNYRTRVEGVCENGRCVAGDESVEDAECERALNSEWVQYRRR